MTSILSKGRFSSRHQDLFEDPLLDGVLPSADAKSSLQSHSQKPSPIRLTSKSSEPKLNRAATVIGLTKPIKRYFQSRDAKQDKSVVNDYTGIVTESLESVEKPVGASLGETTSFFAMRRGPKKQPSSQSFISEWIKGVPPLVEGGRAHKAKFKRQDKSFSSINSSIDGREIRSSSRFFSRRSFNGSTRSDSPSLISPISIQFPKPDNALGLDLTPFQSPTSLQFPLDISMAESSDQTIEANNSVRSTNVIPLSSKKLKLEIPNSPQFLEIPSLEIKKRKVLKASPPPSSRPTVLPPLANPLSESRQDQAITWTSFSLLCNFFIPKHSRLGQVSTTRRIALFIAVFVEEYFLVTFCPPRRLMEIGGSGLLVVYGILALTIAYIPWVVLIDERQ